MGMKNLSRFIPLVLLLILVFTLCSCDKFFSQKENINRGKSEETELASSESSLNSRDSLTDLNSENNGSKTLANVPLTPYPYTKLNSSELPDVAIIVDDFGYNGKLLERFAQELPAEVAFAVLPNLPYTRKAGEIASQYGHPVLIHIPMEGTGVQEKQCIKNNSSADEITALLDDFYAQLPMAVGANNHQGSSVTENREIMTIILDWLNKHNLFFVDSATSKNSVAQSLAYSRGYPALKRDIFLDVPDDTEQTLANKISSLNKYQGRKEPIIIITHCHNEKKLSNLQSFIREIRSQGLHLTNIINAKNIAA